MSKFKAGILWNIVRTLSQRALIFFQQLILARILVPEIFGRFSTLSSIFAITSLFAVFGHTTLLISKSKSLKNFLPIFNTFNYILILISFIFFTSVSAFIFGHSYENLIEILIYGLSIPFIALKTADQVKLEIEGRYLFLSLTNVLFTIILVFLSIFLAHYGFKIFSLIISFTVASIVEFIILRARTKLNFQISKSFQKNKFFIIKSSELLIHNLAWRIINYVDFIIIGYLLGKSKSGIYFMAFGLSVQVMNLLTSYMPGLFFSSNIRDQFTIQDLNLRMQKLILFLIIISSPIIFIIFFYAEYLIGILFENNWNDMIPILKILILSIIPKILSSQWIQQYFLKNNFKKISKISSIYAIIFILFVSIGTYYFDIYGTSYAILAFNICTIFLVHKIIFQKNIYLKETVNGVLFSFLIVMFFKRLDDFNFLTFDPLVSISFSLLVYTLFLYIFFKKTREAASKTIKNVWYYRNILSGKN